jgi:hypothetical protein
LRNAILRSKHERSQECRKRKGIDKRKSRGERNKRRRRSRREGRS